MGTGTLTSGSLPHTYRLRSNHGLRWIEIGSYDGAQGCSGRIRFHVHFGQQIELATLDNEMERNRSSRKAALAALDSSDSATSSLSQLSSSASSSVNIKKRTMKTTVTSETVRY